MFQFFEENLNKIIKFFSTLLQLISKNKKTDRKLVKPREYVGCIYNKEVRYGIVEEYCEDFDNFKVNFLHPSVSSKINTYYYSFNKDLCVVLEHHIFFNEASSPKKRQENSIYFSQKKLMKALKMLDLCWIAHESLKLVKIILCSVNYFNYYSMQVNNNKG